MSAERPAYQQRVIEEHDALKDKLLKLKAFIDLPAYRKLPAADRDLLNRQWYAMAEYQSVLCERIARFEAQA